jgi:hypothetical protein
VPQRVERIVARAAIGTRDPQQRRASTFSSDASAPRRTERLPWYAASSKSLRSPVNARQIRSKRLRAARSTKTPFASEAKR